MARRIKDRQVGVPGDTTIRETPGVCGGYPCVGYTRVAVRLIVEAFRDTGSLERTQELYPMLTLDQVRSAMEHYAAYPTRVDEDIERNRRVWEELTGQPWPA